MQNLVYQTKINDKNVQFFFLEQIADVREGLATGDNKYYLYKEENALGKYKIIDKKKLIDKDELNKISKNVELRKEIINNGFDKKLFNGRTVVPYDKGGSSNIDEAQLNNYYSPTKFFIDWSTENVKRLKTFTISDIKKFYGKKPSIGDEKKIASRFQNMDFSFKQGITFPMTGIYAPTFRLNSNSLFGHGGNCLFIKKEYQKIFSIEYLLGILCSKFTKYCFKNYVNNTVNTPPDSYTKLLIPICDNKKKSTIEHFVQNIIKNLKSNSSYNYQNKDQQKIDTLIYDLFGLDLETINEIENWYGRKYPKLVTKN